MAVGVVQEAGDGGLLEERRERDRLAEICIHVQVLDSSRLLDGPNRETNGIEDRIQIQNVP